MNNDKQLTPEEDNDCPQCRGCGGGELVNGYMICPFCKGTGTNEWVSKQDNGNPTPEEFLRGYFGNTYHLLRSGEVESYCGALNQYNQQQTAAKDERIQRLEGFLRTRTAERDGVIELRDKLKSDNKEKDERIKELGDHLQVFKEELDSVLSLCGVQHVAGSAKNVPVTVAVTFKLKEKNACIAKLEKERDQAFDLLEQVEHEESEWKIQRHKLLSSRENKKP